MSVATLRARFDGPRRAGRFVRGARAATCAALLLAPLWLGDAHASEPPLRIVGDSKGCPSPEAVALRLRALVPGVRVAIGAVPGPRRSTVLLWNEAQQYSVTVAGHERVIDGQRQSCDERARAAAVVVALALFPPTAPPPPTEPRQPPASSAPPAIRAAAKPARARWSFEASALFDGAPGSSGGYSPAAGVALRALVGGGRWSGGLGVGAVAWASAVYGALAVRTRRFPLDVSARVTWPAGPVAIALDAGLYFGIVGFSAPGLAERTDATRLELGARFAATLRVPLGRRWAPFLSTELFAIPRPFELSFAPAGPVGESPRARLTVALGLAFTLDP